MANQAKVSVREALAELSVHKKVYERYRNGEAQYAVDVLRKVLRDVPLRHALNCDFQAEKHGIPIRSEYPRWARHLAHVLTNPERKYSAEVVELLLDHLRKLCDEFESGDHQPHATKLLALGPQPALLTEISFHLLREPLAGQEPLH